MMQIFHPKKRNHIYDFSCDRAIAQIFLSSAALISLSDTRCSYFDAHSADSCRQKVRKPFPTIFHLNFLEETPTHFLILGQTEACQGKARLQSATRHNGRLFLILRSQKIGSQGISKSLRIISVFIRVISAQRSLLLWRRDAARESNAALPSRRTATMRSCKAKVPPSPRIPLPSLC